MFSQRVFYKHLRNCLKKSSLNTLFAKLDFDIEFNKSKYIILIFYYFFKYFIIIYIVSLMP